jgi:hypothetical protein
MHGLQVKPRAAQQLPVLRRSSAWGRVQVERQSPIVHARNRVVENHKKLSLMSDVKPSTPA